MADFSQSISNTINVFSPTPSSKWGEMLWGSDVWGEGKDFDLVIGKWLSETINSADNWSKKFIFRVTNSISFTSSMDLGPLSDNNGYKYVLKGVTDPDDRLFPDYTEDSQGPTTYSSVANSSTDWEDA